MAITNEIHLQYFSLQVRQLSLAADENKSLKDELDIYRDKVNRPLYVSHRHHSHLSCTPLVCNAGH